MSSRAEEAGLDGSRELERTARKLRARTVQRKGGGALPTLWLVTDPLRVPDPAAAAERLPPGSGVVFRGFGRPGSEAQAHALGRVCRARGLTLLVGYDARLAAQVGADGVHLPEWALHLAPRLRRAQPGWMLTGAAHSAAALRRARRFGVDAAFLSPVFRSRSPSAGRPRGALWLARLAREAQVPVIALGGVDARTAQRAAGAGVAGLAAVEALAGPRPVRT